MRILTFILPIVVYFVAEWLLGPLYAMAIAIATTLIFAVVDFFKTGRIAASHISDIIIIVVFGLIEYYFASQQGILYIVTPIMIAALLFLALHTRFNIFASMGGGMLGMLLRNPYNRYNIRRTMRRMILWCFVMAFAYYYSLSYPETKLALWINDYMLFTVFLGYIATEIVVSRITRHKYKNCEWVPIVDEKTSDHECKIVGQAPRPLVHNGSHWLHPVVHLHVIDNGRLLLQLRPNTKKIQPGKWDTAVGGHIVSGEDIQKSLKREAWEEIGLRDFKAQLICHYVWRSKVENEFVFSFVTEHGGPFMPKNAGEVADLKFWSKKEIEEAFNDNIFTPNLEHELRSWILNKLK